MFRPSDPQYHISHNERARHIPWYEYIPAISIWSNAWDGLPNDEVLEAEDQPMVIETVE